MWPALHFRNDIRPMLALAWPVVVAELGWMLMGVVDALMLGRVSPEALGAAGMGSSIFLALGIFGMGLLLGLDTLVSHAYGAGSLLECHRWLLHGIYLALLLSAPVIVVVHGVTGTMDAWGIHPDVLPLVQRYLLIVAWSALPLLLHAAFRRYLQSVGSVRPIMVALVSANAINVSANWLLIFGHLGMPAMGVRGAAWATVIARVYMAAFLAIAIVWHERRLQAGLFTTPLRIEAWRLVRLLRLGGPAATQLLAEVGVFATATALAGRLDPIALASHQIALNLAGVSFMVPYGVSSAGAVRVGHAIGRRDVAGANRAGWSAIMIGVAFMTCAALAFVLIPDLLVRVFSADPAVITLGVTLLYIAASFQLFDGLQGVATGVLRGVGDTRTAMTSNLAGHWLVGLPVGYALCFVFGWGIAGLWIGLSVGLILVAVALLTAWVRQIHTLRIRTVVDC